MSGTYLEFKKNSLAATHKFVPLSPGRERQAWVVFSGQVDLPWLRVLKPGFRHCYLVIRQADRWVTYDPLASHTELLVHDMNADFDMLNHLRSRGLRVIRAAMQPRGHSAPWGLFSCVEAVKRVIGLHNAWVLTPYQLYCHLTQLHKA